MNKKDFLYLIYGTGINLKDHDIYLANDDQPLHLANVYSVLRHKDKEAETKGEYKIVRALPDHKIKNVFGGNEEECFNNLHQILLKIMKQHGEINNSITPEIAEMTEKEFCKLWQKQDKNPSAIEGYEEAWKARLDNIRALNEVKYYLLNHEFVSDQDAYRVANYTAKQISKETNLEPINAIDFLAYLDRNFDDAFSDLIKLENKADEKEN